MKIADAVFRGRVESIWGPDRWRQDQIMNHDYTFPHEVVFTTVAAWKGVHESQVITFNTPSPIWDIGVWEDHEYLVFARRFEDGRLHLVGCGEIKPVEQAEEDLRDLGAPSYVYQEEPTGPKVRELVDCTQGWASAKQRMAEVDAVFRGYGVTMWGWPRVFPEDRPYYSTPGAVLFVVESGWKGVHEPRVLVWDDTMFPADCSYQGCLVFATRTEDGRLHISGCGDTQPDGPARRYLHELGHPEFVPEVYGRADR
jgi:hypothetical protein